MAPPEPIGSLALLAAAVSLVKPGTPGPAGQPGAAGQPGPSGANHVYERHLWVDPRAGDNNGDGSEGDPLETLDTVWQRMGQPTSQQDFEEPWTVTIVGSGSANVGVLPIPCRRITINAPGMTFDPLLWEIDEALLFGSMQPPELHINGEGSTALLGALIPTPTQVGYAVVGDLGTAILVRNVGIGTGVHLLELTSVAIRGGLLTDGVATSGIGPVLILNGACSFQSSGLGIHPVGLPAGPGVASILDADHALFLDAGGGPVPIALNSIYGAEACLMNVAMNILAAPTGPLNAGLRACRFQPGSTFVGPPASLFADATTNYWINVNGVVIPGATFQPPVATPATTITTEAL